MKQVSIPNNHEQRDLGIDIISYLHLDTIWISIRKASYNRYYLSYHDTTENNDYESGIYSDDLEYLVRKMYHYARNLQED